ncbi:hypothetical protein GIB67_042125 [Kingdonia uniflora]|uniref:Uncharacterized protein n=1 Tax=Kingdonia uniflora TaxID=39325 RepID=A0A7J7NPG2_9MAGN|nr:hypothetical protein GIB67_042125 [Kingdonia uniflora]
MAYNGIVAQERFRHDSRKTLKNRENEAHKIYQGLNGDNDFKHREAYKILVRESRWANLRDDGLNHAENIPRNIARRTSDNSSPGNSVRSNNLSEDPDSHLHLNLRTQMLNWIDHCMRVKVDPSAKNSLERTLQHKRHWMVLLHLVAISKQCLMNYDWRRDKRKKKKKEEEQKSRSKQHWQAKMDFEQAKEDRKIIKKDLSTLFWTSIAIIFAKAT